ncbi:sugar phosphate isomerase/epimerase [bacterium]|nr:sugar phosphate isomerase/epimerase [bacterium]
MQFGVCAAVEQVPILEREGCDFLEVTVQQQLASVKGEEAFAEEKKKILGSPLRVPVANCFLPGNMPVTGPVVNMNALEQYAKTVFKRARQVQMDTIVFGSGGARGVPEGFDRKQAWKQLVLFGKAIAPLAGEEGIMVVVEPLNRQECNILNEVGECADYVREVDHPHFKLLVDAYHWYREDDSIDDLVANGDLLRHAHIASPEDRVAPGLDTFSFDAFFECLREVEYTGRLSIECRWGAFDEDVATGLKTLREYAAKYGL